MYNPGLERYILTMEHSFNQKGDLAMYDAPEPWGPWTTVVYTQDFGWPGFGNNSYMWVISNKWLSEDGKDFVLIVTGAQDDRLMELHRGTL